MERLTKQGKNGIYGLANVKDNEQEVDSPYPNTLKAILEAFQRLAEYENTGLEPSEILQNPDSKMKCEKCGHEIETVLVNMFGHEGADAFHEQPLEENGGVAIIDTNQNWTGCDQSEEEMTETILCPHCKKFPFKSTEIDVYNVVRVVCFKSETDKGEINHD